MCDRITVTGGGSIGPSEQNKKKKLAQTYLDCLFLLFIYGCFAFHFVFLLFLLLLLLRCLHCLSKCSFFLCVCVCVETVLSFLWFFSFLGFFFSSQDGFVYFHYCFIRPALIPCPASPKLWHLFLLFSLSIISHIGQRGLAFSLSCFLKLQLEPILKKKKKSEKEGKKERCSHEAFSCVLRRRRRRKT